MQDKVKVVYSWIGPRGPIWNTELPNILGFAGVAEGSQSNSHYYWADDSWCRMFGTKKSQFEMYPAFGIDVADTSTFIIPFSLSWRVTFEHYFCGKTGILEFSHIPWHLIKLVRDGNGYILIDHSVEAFMADGQLKVMHGYFREIHSLPLSKIMYLTGAMNAKEIYNDFCDRYNIPDTTNERLTIISYPSSLDVFSKQISNKLLYEPEYDTEKVPEKLLLMWNRRYRRHRVELALGLEHKNLIDRSLVSFSEVDIENPTRSFRDVADIKNIEHFNYGLNVTVDDAERFAKKLPLVIDGETDNVKMCEDRDNTARKYFQKTLVSLVTETNWAENEVTLTEKSFKPIKEKHPFIIVGVKGVLKSIRDLGFKTFNEFWNESYDEIDCPQQRLVAIANVCEEIGKWTPEQIINFKRKVKPILEHNWELLKKPLLERTIQTIHDHVVKPQPTPVSLSNDKNKLPTGNVTSSDVVNSSNSVSKNNTVNNEIKTPLKGVIP